MVKKLEKPCVKMKRLSPVPILFPNRLAWASWRNCLRMNKRCCIDPPAWFNAVQKERVQQFFNFRWEDEALKL